MQMRATPFIAAPRMMGRGVAVAGVVNGAGQGGAEERADGCASVEHADDAAGVSDTEVFGREGRDEGNESAISGAENEGEDGQRPGVLGGEPAEEGEAHRRERAGEGLAAADTVR